jgi:exopolyphosphatase/guanosine-5'-triphosphate,3'-diphosphate pyrophosphatase
MRVATIDIGTNTVLLLIVESLPDGSMLPLAERATITRLGAGVDRTRTLSPEAIARTRACLETYARVIEELVVERTAVVGTSAVRDCGGAGELRTIVNALFGVDVRVLSGAEEARLTFAGALSGLEVPYGSEIAVFDIGGGSTEVVEGLHEGGEADLSYVESFDLGSVRLTERHVVNDPPTPAELAALERHTREAFARVPPLRSNETPVGVAGTMTTLAAVALGVSPYVGSRVHGRVLDTEQLRRVLQHLSALDLRARKLLPGMEPMRADVIVAGGTIALGLLDHWHSEAVRVSDRGLRWGIARELVARSPLS